MYVYAYVFYLPLIIKIAYTSLLKTYNDKNDYVYNVKHITIYTN